MTTDGGIPGYRVLRALGRGQTSLVSLAVDERGQKVALKIPHPETLKDSKAAERFGNEVRLSLRLRHPRVVEGLAGTAFGAGAFLAMQYFPEGTLTRWMEIARLTPEEAYSVGADIAEALAYLHAQDMIHQDVKAQNVYLKDGRAALGDFGSAYFASQGGKPAGSPFYMAPEIYLGETSSPASDVYSLGVLLYEMLGGRRPHVAATYDALMAAHLNAYPAPLASLAPNLPAGVTRVVERALAKRASDRPDAQTIHDMLVRAQGKLTLSDAVAAPPPAAAVPPAKAVGRHGATPAPAKPEPQPPAPEPRGFSFNPFKKRKG
ncbi:serine/threonine-protein kinase [Deinococcus maricopensis]|uniref:Serine/threonine protein kinase n=1 Tax=Deinococcus maricopensis (strain DSM 21211 / LMG 22137 / NRRL B-23946 / LB-34) TaxID=709986 RepID=E8U3M8_DEIML|nr:serine/threonine-protein kinase [Deinococcus maricopensis]ADV68652.1 serine/threonine protein kinase [Deinococcus maricopensis DSM 21211]